MSDEEQLTRIFHFGSSSEARDCVKPSSAIDKIGGGRSDTSGEEIVRGEMRTMLGCTIISRDWLSLKANQRRIVDE